MRHAGGTPPWPNTHRCSVLIWEGMTPFGLAKSRGRLTSLSGLRPSALDPSSPPQPLKLSPFRPPPFLPELTSLLIRSWRMRRRGMRAHKARAAAQRTRYAVLALSRRRILRAPTLAIARFQPCVFSCRSDAGARVET